MADAKKEYLYSVVQDGPYGNETLKNKAREIGANIKFDRESGAYELQIDGLAKKDITALKSQLGEFVGKEAKGRWEEERAAFQSKKDNLLAEVKSRAETTQEPKPEKVVARDDDAIAMFPALSQKKAFRDLLVESGSMSRFQKARGDEIAHYRVTTASPEKFVEYVGEAAKERYQREYADYLAKGGKTPDQGVDTNTPVEQARDAARARAGSAFMAQYKDRGFLLADPARDAANHQRQLSDMRAATRPQLLAVIQQSRAILDPLREKELNMRAEAAGIPVDQVKKLSFDDQKKITGADGKSVGLVGDDYAKHMALTRGISAMNLELRSREGIGEEKREAAPARDQAQGQNKAQGKAGDRAPARGVSEESSVDSDFALLAAGYKRQGQSQGR